MRPQVRLLMLLAALVAAVTLVACGGSDSETEDRSATEILEETFQGGDGVDSGVLTLALDIEAQEGSGTGTSNSLKLTGPFEVAESDDEMPKFDFDLTIAAPGAQSLQAGAISTGDAGFLSFQGTDYAVGDELFAQFRDSFLQAQREADEQDQPTLQALGIDPNAWVVDPQKAGTEEIGGVETEHITAGVDVDRLLEDLQRSAEQASGAAGQATQLSPEDVASVRDQIDSATVDVFTGTEDLRLRRLVVDVTLKTGSAAFTLEIADLDEPQDIQAPSDPKPVEELVQQFQQLFGGLGATGGAVPGASGSGDAAGDDQRYLACVQEAGQDVEKLQACAKFL